MMLRSYTAPSMAKAMARVREELGEDAVIVSTDSDGETGRVRLTAALDRAPMPPTWSDDVAASASLPEDLGVLVPALTYHGVPGWLVDRLVDTAWDSGAEGALLALGAALDTNFRFIPMAEADDRRPLLLVGVPGAGKSTVAAKLAAYRTLASRPVELISMDTVRPGAIEQLRAITRVMDTRLHQPATVEGLRRVVRERNGEGRLVIDTHGVNPFASADMAAMAEIVVASEAEPVLVLAAGGDPAEAEDIASSFKSIGVERVTVSRLDVARRYGGALLTAACHLALSDASYSPHVASGFNSLNPLSLARLLANRAAHVEPASAFNGSPYERNT